MKKIIGIVLVVSIFQVLAVFSTPVTFVQTSAADEKANTDINPLKKELKEEKEALVGLNDELDFITEHEKDTQETIAYINEIKKEMESDIKVGKATKESLKEDLDSLNEELSAELITLDEIGDEKGAYEELKKETEDTIAELTAKIQKEESTKVAVNTKAAQQKPAETSAVSATSAKKLSPADNLKEQIRSAKADIDDEIELMDETDEEIEILQEEIQELEEQREEAEEAVLDLLAQIKQFESALAAIEAK
jgi:chromosome segregation ATPase